MSTTNRDVQVWKRKDDGARIVVQYEYTRGCVPHFTFDLATALANHDFVGDAIAARVVKLR